MVACRGLEAKSANCPHHQTALVLALERSDLSAVQQLLERGANPNEKGTLLSGAPVHPFAFEMNRVLSNHKPLNESVRFAELLQQNGANVDERLNGNRQTALYMFAMKCNVEGVKLLRRLKADPNIESRHKKNATGAALSSKKCGTSEQKKRLMEALSLKEE